MKVSVITPVMNGARTIQRAIDSVLRQSYTDIEYIIVDGKSSDGTLDIIHQYGSAISKVISEEDAGIYDAMNKGIREANGEIVGILNSDDFYFEWTVEDVVNVFNSGGCGIVYGNLLKVEENSVVCNMEIVRPSGGPEMLPKKPVIFHPGAFIRKDIYNDIGCYDDTFRLIADYEFYLRAYTEGVDFKYTESTLSGFAMGGRSSSCYKFWEGFRLIRRYRLPRNWENIVKLSKCIFKKLIAHLRIN